MNRPTPQWVSPREPIWCDDHNRVEEIDDDFDDEDRHGRPIRVAITDSGCTFTTRIRPARPTEDWSAA